MLLFFAAKILLFCGIHKFLQEFALIFCACQKKVVPLQPFFGAKAERKEFYFKKKHKKSFSLK